MLGPKPFTDKTHVNHGEFSGLAPRSFLCFEQAASEAALSRLYAGIHYGFDNDDGFACGRLIGRAVLERVRFSASRQAERINPRLRSATSDIY
jgi:hypothetical protein